MRNVCKKGLVLGLAIAALSTVSGRVQAQTVLPPLVEFTNSWRYDNTGRDLGTAWRATGYTPDAQWLGPSPGLIGYEPDTPFVYESTAPIGTELQQLTTVTSYYFRTSFNFSGNPALAYLNASILVDDGLVIYLNGLDVGRLRVPINQTATTQSSGLPASVEGNVETLVLTNVANALRVGINVLAVEVHGVMSGSYDMMFGMKLVATIATPLTITTQPLSQTVSVNDTVDLTVGVSGGPVTYRWQKGAGSTYTNIPGATNLTYSISPVAFTNAGDYRVICSNLQNVVTSTVASLTVTSDTTGPELVTAIINDPSQTTTNTILLKFSEQMIGITVQNTNNYRLFSATDSSIQIPIVAIQYNVASGARILVQGTNANWSPTGSYYLVVNNVSDNNGNNINPNSVIGVSYLVTTNLTQMSDIWSYYDCSDVDVCDSGSASNYLNEAWAKTNFVQSAKWGAGQGIFAAESGIPDISCAGDMYLTPLSFQFDPTLFRRTFVLPAGVSPSGTLRLRFLYDDGMAVYLNGQLLTNINCTLPITQASRATASVIDAACTSGSVNVINNLRPGTNWLCAAVLQNLINHEGDTVFGFEMDLVTLKTGRVPTNYPVKPTITRSRQQGTNFILSWPVTNYGYALMYSTAITDYGYSYKNGAPISGTPGPNPAQRWFTNEPVWIQVKDQSNPYTNRLPAGATGPRRFYKLYREKLN